MTINPKSTLNIGGHPLHPMAVYFPIAFFVGAFITDVVGYVSPQIAWLPQASYWLLLGGLVTAVLAALGGLTDFLGDRRIRQLGDAWWHAGINIVVVFLEAVNWYLRHKYGPSPIETTGIAFSAVSAVLLVFSGWKGGELVFRHRVGVLDRPTDS